MPSWEALQGPKSKLVPRKSESVTPDLVDKSHQSSVRSSPCQAARATMYHQALQISEYTSTSQICNRSGWKKTCDPFHGIHACVGYSCESHWSGLTFKTISSSLRIQWELKAQLYKFGAETCSYLWKIKSQGSLESRDKGQNKDAARWQVCDSFDITGKAFTVNWRIGSWFRTFLTGPAISSTFWLAFASHGTERFGNLNENLSEATALRQKNPSRKLTVWLVARTLSPNNTFLNLHPSAQKNICDGKRWNWSQIFGVIVLRRK